MAEVLTWLVAVRKVFGLGASIWKAATDKETFNQNDLEAMRSLVDTAEGIVPFKTIAELPSELKHVALITASFEGAFRRFWKVKADEPNKDFQKHYEALHRDANQFTVRLGDFYALQRELLLADDLLREPLQTNYYRELWALFVDKPLDLTKDLSEPKQRRSFERYFMLEYHQLSQTTLGKSLQQTRANIEAFRKQVIHDLLVQDIANWGERHIFGNLPRDSQELPPELPFLPLQDMYVEPLLQNEFGETSEVGALQNIKQLLQNRQRIAPIVVLGNFGQGKSLTARCLGRDLAEEYLQKGPSSGVPFPVFIRCAQDIVGGVNLAQIVKCAWKRHSDSLGLALELEDVVWSLPSSDTPVVFLLDGLDEVFLGNAQEKLFETLWGKSSNKWRFVIFSRPGAFPEEYNLRRETTRLVLAPFKDSQIEAWVSKWNWLQSEHAESMSQPSPPILRVEQLSALKELTQTPILLFMLASTWKRQPDQPQQISRAEIYERFFWHIAQGKYKHDKEKHPTVATAAITLNEILQKKEGFPPNTEPPMAMLWLMSRVAWEVHRLARPYNKPEEATQQNEDSAPALDQHSLNQILVEELGLRLSEEGASLLKQGLLLVLQVSPHSKHNQILFGHQSFREFLVARYWAHQLRKIPKYKDKLRQAEERKLCRGRLLGIEDKSFLFLMEILKSEDFDVKQIGSPFGWQPLERERLFEWAEACFNNEDQRFEDEDQNSSIFVDQRALLREAALAIGCNLLRAKSISAHSPRGLRSLLAWFFAWGEPMILRAPRASFEFSLLFNIYLEEADFLGANLCGANFEGAHLPKANLQEANLEGAGFLGANLFGANLQKANLRGTYLEAANLVGADLQEADLEAAILQGANLQRANLQEANLWKTRLQRTYLQGAYLQKANLEGADFQGANLLGANLQEANLSKAHFQQANLSGANLQEACLREAHLEAAILRETRLVGAYLEGANLEGANLQRANLQGARLQGAYLERISNFEFADLRGADLSQEQKQFAKQAGAVVDETTES